MAKEMKLSIRQQKIEARLVAGVCDKDKRAQSEMYDYCLNYFRAKYRGVFFADEEDATEVFQNAFITMWEKIENRKIYVCDGRVMGRDGKPFSSSILTYFMKIAQNKYRELARDRASDADPETAMAKKIREEGVDEQQCAVDVLYDRDENTMYDIIADVISNMSRRCSEILSKFYYEEKNLDAILLEIPTINSKDALKNRKHKCMESLRATAQSIYHNYLNQ